MSWRARAACRTARADAFFELEDAAEENRPPDPERVEYALGHCAACPVREACLEAGGRMPGIWGGTTAAERRRGRR